MRRPAASPLPVRIFALLLLTAGLVRAEIEFRGVLVALDKSLFGLADSAAPDAQEWVTTGDTFAGWTVGDYNPATRTLQLTKDGDTQTVRLKEPVPEATTPLVLQGKAGFKVGNRTVEQPVAMDYDRATVLNMGDGQTGKITPHQLPDGSISYQVVVETVVPAGGNRTATKVANSGVTALPGTPFTIQTSNLTFSFTPKYPVPTPQTAPVPP